MTDRMSPRTRGSKARRQPLVLAVVAGVALLGQGQALADNTSGVKIPPEPSFNKKSPALYGKQLAAYADLYNKGWVDSYIKSTITNVSANGETSVSRTRQLLLEGEGGNKALIRYVSPASVRGVAALTHEDNSGTDESWLYLPSNRRVRRISGANRTASFQGTEFSYEDLSALVPSRYEWRFVKETKSGGARLLQLEAVPTYRDSGYSRLHVYVNPDGWRPERTDFYDKGGRLLKVLRLSKWREYHGRFWRPNKLEMHNRQTQKRSVIEIDVQFVNISKYKRKDGSTREGLKESAFTRRALEMR